MPGPGYYNPKNDLFNQLQSKPGMRIIKPVIFDEHLYEIVNGTTKVLQTQYMKKPLRKSFEMKRITLAAERPHKSTRLNMNETFIH